MAKPKKKLQGSVDRGKTQPAKAGNPGAVLSHRFKPGSDASAKRHSVNVAGYSPHYQKAASKIDAILRRGSK